METNIRIYNANEAAEVSKKKQQDNFDIVLNNVFEKIKETARKGGFYLKVKIKTEFDQKIIETLKEAGYDIDMITTRDGVIDIPSECTPSTPSKIFKISWYPKEESKPEINKPIEEDRVPDLSNDGYSKNSLLSFN